MQLVSIVTPTKNRRGLLLDVCMTSVAAQSYHNWEHLIVDDGSDDGTEEAVQKIAARDPRIRFIKRTDSKGGANVCRNIGVRESNGDYVIFLDSDDLLRPDCLARRVGFMQRNADVDFAVYPAGVFMETVGDMGRNFHPLTPGDDLVRFLSHECVWEITGPIWRRSYLEKIGSFDETLMSMQDMELHVRAICGGGRYTFVREVDHDISWRPDFKRVSVRYIYEAAYQEAAYRVRAKMHEAVSRAGLMTWSRQRALMGLCFEAAEFLAHVGKFRLGLRVWHKECRHYAVKPALRTIGIVMLILTWMAGRHSEGFLDRVVNKMKGWVRFRQEPALMKEVGA